MSRTASFAYVEAKDEVSPLLKEKFHKTEYPNDEKNTTMTITVQKLNIQGLMEMMEVPKGVLLKTTCKDLIDKRRSLLSSF